MNTQIWIDQLEQLIQQKHMLSTPFYQAWSNGTLSKSTLQAYAREYYQHVKAFPTYLSALHSRCENPIIRRSLLTNLIDEEAGEPNHPDLWKAFALHLGVPQQELETHAPNQATQTLIATFRESCTLHPIAVGLAALYSYESQIPAICQTKIDGLRKWYGLTDPQSYRYFSLHQTVDIEHSHEEKKLLTALVQPGEESAALQGADKVLNALNDFLDSFTTDCPCEANL
jgi:pyrroloquinoline-quinone synthase